jgi:hypothetical protein
VSTRGRGLLGDGLSGFTGPFRGFPVYLPDHPEVRHDLPVSLGRSRRRLAGLLSFIAWRGVRVLCRCGSLVPLRAVEFVKEPLRWVLPAGPGWRWRGGKVPSTAFRRAGTGSGPGQGVLNGLRRCAGEPKTGLRLPLARAIRSAVLSLQGNRGCSLPLAHRAASQRARPNSTISHGLVRGTVLL